MRFFKGLFWAIGLELVALALLFILGYFFVAVMMCM